MNLLRPLCILTLLASAGTVDAQGPATTGALATPANRIVGTWANVARVGSCATGVLGPALNQTLMYNAGGTMLDNPRFPPQGIATPGGVVQRSIGIGTWTYDPVSGQHFVRQQFDFFLSNVYDGYQVIETTRQLSNDGNRLTGPVVASRYNAAGELLFQQCGEAVSTRL
ncbi:hypothetical protein [Luteimonas vadosa]|uniref:Lipocalin-like domain-containing protein n=1 Tax=Luteimonas vadosa TaxID=1165507 RepID=A0ABP9DQY1_9GAMM